jgi:hypothetical protein
VDNTASVSGAISTDSTYQIAGSTILSNTGTANLFVGIGAGTGNGAGTYNNYVGYQAGYDTSASYNTFDGAQAGYQAVGTDDAVFSGYRAGYQAVDSDYSVFVGYQAGQYASLSDLSNFIGGYAGQYASLSTWDIMLARMQTTLTMWCSLEMAPVDMPEIQIILFLQEPMLVNMRLIPQMLFL